MVLPILVAVLVTLTLAAGYYALTTIFYRDASRIQQRVDSEFRKEASATVMGSVLFKNLDKVDLDKAPSLPAAESMLPPATETSPRARLEALLHQADIRLAVRQLLILAAGLGLVLGVAGTLLRGPLLGVIAAAAGAAVPFVYLRQRRQKRQEKLLSQLPAAFDLMARIIRAGQSVPQALQAVAEGFDGPLAAEFARCHKQQSLGLRPETVFQEMAQRTDLLELRIFVMAMLLQRQTGGNLSEVLGRLSALTRERLRLRRQVLTLTAEGRLQGLTLIVLPFLLFLALWIMNRKYAEVLLGLPHLLAAMFVMMVVGVIWIRRIVHFDT